MGCESGSSCEAVSYWCKLCTSESLYLLGAVILLLFFLIQLRRRQPKSIVAYKTENGNVIINRSAIVELVRTSCEQISQVSKPRLKVLTKKGLTHFTIHIELISGAHLKDVEENLQNHLRENLHKNLGIEKLGDVNIIVTSFKSSKVKSVDVGSTHATPQTQVQEEEIHNEPDDFGSFENDEK